MYLVKDQWMINKYFLLLVLPVLESRGFTCHLFRWVLSSIGLLLYLIDALQTFVQRPRACDTVVMMQTNSEVLRWLWECFTLTLPQNLSLPDFRCRLRPSTAYCTFDMIRDLRTDVIAYNQVSIRIGYSHSRWMTNSVWSLHTYACHQVN